MALVIQDTKGLLIDYLPSGQTITGRATYYTNLLNQLQQNIYKKGHVLQRRVIFHQKRNACTHVIAMAKIN